MTVVGAVLRPQVPPERMRAVALAAEESGLPELWLWEDCFLESGIASAAAILAWTSRLRVGVGVLPVPLRNVALAAMEIATLERLFPGRSTIGVGHGVQRWMGQVGARAESPLTLLREYLDALRALLRGERVTTSGRYVRLDQVALDWPPPSAPPVLSAAAGPRTLRLTGEAADGTILTARATPDDVRQARRAVAEGSPGEPRLFVYVMAAAPGPDTAARLEAERQAMGYGSDGWVTGSPPEAAEAVMRWAQAGADHVILQPTADEPDPEGFVRWTAAISDLSGG